MATEENEFELECKTLTGNVHTVIATGSMLVGELKEKVAAEAGCSSSQLRIMKRPKFLKPDTETLANFGITKSMKLKVIIRIGGVVPKMDVELSTNGQKARSVALSHDDRLAVAGTYVGGLFMFDVATGNRLVAKDKVHEGAIRRIMFNKSNTHFVTGGGDGKVILWRFDGSDIHEEKTFLMSAGPGDGSSCQLWSVNFSQDGKLLACSGDRYGSALVFDVESGELVSSFTHANGARQICCARFNSNASWVASSDSRKQLYIWEARTGNELQYIPNCNSGSCWNLAIPKDDKHIFTVGCGASIYQYETESWTCVRKWSTRTNDCCLFRDDKFIAFIGGGQNSLCLINLDKPEEEFAQINVPNLSRPEQNAQSHFKNAFIFHTARQAPEFCLIPENEFFALL